MPVLSLHHPVLGGSRRKRRNGPGAKAKKHQVGDDPRVTQAARTWADLKPLLDEAVESLQRASNNFGKDDIE